MNPEIGLLIATLSGTPFVSDLPPRRDVRLKFRLTACEETPTLRKLHPFFSSVGTTSGEGAIPATAELLAGAGVWLAAAAAALPVDAENEAAFDRAIAEAEELEGPIDDEEQ